MTSFRVESHDTARDARRRTGALLAAFASCALAACGEGSPTHDVQYVLYDSNGVVKEIVQASPAAEGDPRALGEDRSPGSGDPAVDAWLQVSEGARPEFNESEEPEDANAGSTTVQSKFDRTSRVVANTRAFPYSTVGQLNVQYPDGSRGRCTGTMIGVRHVLTAAHCIENGAGVIADNITFEAGRQGESRPFGSVQAKSIRKLGCYSLRDIRNDFDRFTDCDVAIVILSTDLGRTTGWHGYGAINGPVPRGGLRATYAGYAANAGGGSQMREERDMSITERPGGAEGGRFRVIGTALHAGSSGAALRTEVSVEGRQLTFIVGVASSSPRHTHISDWSALNQWKVGFIRDTLARF